MCRTRWPRAADPASSHRSSRSRASTESRTCLAERAERAERPERAQRPESARRPKSPGLGSSALEAPTAPRDTPSKREPASRSGTAPTRGALRVPPTPRVRRLEPRDERRTELDRHDPPRSRRPLTRVHQGLTAVARAGHSASVGLGLRIHAHQSALGAGTLGPGAISGVVPRASA